MTYHVEVEFAGQKKEEFFIHNMKDFFQLLGEVQNKMVQIWEHPHHTLLFLKVKIVQ